MGQSELRDNRTIAIPDFGTLDIYPVLTLKVMLQCFPGQNNHKSTFVIPSWSDIVALTNQPVTFHDFERAGHCGYSKMGFYWNILKNMKLGLLMLCMPTTFTHPIQHISLVVIIMILLLLFAFGTMTSHTRTLPLVICGLVFRLLKKIKICPTRMAP